MRKIFRLDGLDCANCAAKIESKISNIDGVTNATVNFMTTKLVIEAENDKITDIIETAKAIIKKIEPDVVIKKA